MFEYSHCFQTVSESHLACYVAACWHSLMLYCVSCMCKGLCVTSHRMCILNNLCIVNKTNYYVVATFLTVMMIAVCMCMYCGCKTHGKGARGSRGGWSMTSWEGVRGG